MTTPHTTPAAILPELLDLIRFQQEYIVAIPSDVATSLPAMPGFDGDWAVDLVERAKALAASAPVAPIPPESLHTFLNAAAAEGYVLNGVDAADLYVELFPERYVAALEGFHSGMHEATLEAAPAPSQYGSPELQDLILAKCAEKVAPLQQGEYLPLPEPAIKACHCYSTNQVREAIDADRAARGAAQPAPAPVAEDAEDAANWKWLAAYLVGPRTDRDDEIVASESVNDLRKLVSAARAHAAQPEGGRQILVPTL